MVRPPAPRCPGAAGLAPTSTVSLGQAARLRAAGGARTGSLAGAASCSHRKAQQLPHTRCLVPAPHIRCAVVRDKIQVKEGASISACLYCCCHAPWCSPALPGQLPSLRSGWEFMAHERASQGLVRGVYICFNSICLLGGRQTQGHVFLA